MPDKGKKDAKNPPKKDAKKGGKNEEKEVTIRPYPHKDDSLPLLFNAFNSGLAGAVGATVVHPLDVLKFRKQMCKQSVSSLSVAKCIQCQEGNLKFFRGLSASLLRQLSYRPTQFMAFYGLHQLYKEDQGREPAFGIMAIMAVIAGCTAPLVSTPPDLVLTRMAPEGRLPPSKRRCYKHVFDAFTKICKDEGALTLWRGTMPTMARGSLICLTQFAAFTELKRQLIEKCILEDGWVSDLSAATIAGFLCACLTMPFDIAKTRIQNFKIVEPHKNPGTLKVMQCIAETEGLRALWKGFWPALIRMSTHAILIILLQDRFAKLYKEHIDEKEPKPDEKGKGKK